MLVRDGIKQKRTGITDHTDQKITTHKQIIDSFAREAWEGPPGPAMTFY